MKKLTKEMMSSKVIRLEYHSEILEELKSYRDAGFKGELVVWDKRLEK